MLAFHLSCIGAAGHKHRLATRASFAKPQCGRDCFVWAAQIKLDQAKRTLQMACLLANLRSICVSRLAPCTWAWLADTLSIETR